MDQRDRKERKKRKEREGSKAIYWVTWVGGGQVECSVQYSTVSGSFVVVVAE